MNQHLIEKLSQQLRNAAEGAVLLGKPELFNFQIHDGVAYSLTNEASITFNEVVSKLLRQKNFSNMFLLTIELRAENNSIVETSAWLQ